MVTEGSLLTNVVMASFWASDNTVAYRPTYNSTANVYVVNPSLQLRKVSNPMMQCSGGTVTFCIYVINTAQFSSAFNVVVEDIMPGDNNYATPSASGWGFAYVNGGRSEWNPQGAGISYGHRWTNVTPPPDIWTGAVDGIADGMVGIYYIRWAISVVGPSRIMMVCFKARVL